MKLCVIFLYISEKWQKLFRILFEIRGTLNAIQGQKANEETTSEDEIKPCDSLHEIRELDAELKTNPALRGQLVNYIYLIMPYLKYTFKLKASFLPFFRLKCLLKSVRQSCDQSATECC